MDSTSGYYDDYSKDNHIFIITNQKAKRDDKYSKIAILLSKETGKVQEIRDANDISISPYILPNIIGDAYEEIVKKIKQYAEITIEKEVSQDGRNRVEEEIKDGIDSIYDLGNDEEIIRVKYPLNNEMNSILKSLNIEPQGEYVNLILDIDLIIQKIKERVQYLGQQKIKLIYKINASIDNYYPSLFPDNIATINYSREGPFVEADYMIGQAKKWNYMSQNYDDSTYKAVNTEENTEFDYPGLKIEDLLKEAKQSFLTKMYFHLKQNKEIYKAKIQEMADAVVEPGEYGYIGIDLLDEPEYDPENRDYYEKYLGTQDNLKTPLFNISNKG